MALFAAVGTVATEPQVIFNDRGTAKCVFRLCEEETGTEGRVFKKFWEICVWGQKGEELGRTLPAQAMVSVEGEARTVVPKHTKCAACGVEAKGGWTMEVSARVVKVLTPSTIIEKKAQGPDDSDRIPF